MGADYFLEHYFEDLCQNFTKKQFQIFVQQLSDDGKVKLFDKLLSHQNGSKFFSYISEMADQFFEKQFLSRLDLTKLLEFSFDKVCILFNKVQFQAFVKKLSETENGLDKLVAKLKTEKTTGTTWLHYLRNKPDGKVVRRKTFEKDYPLLAQKHAKDFENLFEVKKMKHDLETMNEIQAQEFLNKNYDDLGKLKLPKGVLDKVLIKYPKLLTEYIENALKKPALFLHVSEDTVLTALTNDAKLAVKYLEAATKNKMFFSYLPDNALDQLVKAFEKKLDFQGTKFKQVIFTDREKMVKVPDVENSTEQQKAYKWIKQPVPETYSLEMTDDFAEFQKTEAFVDAENALKMINDTYWDFVDVKKFEIKTSGKTWVLKNPETQMEQGIYSLTGEQAFFAHDKDSDDNKEPVVEKNEKAFELKLSYFRSS